MYNPQLKNEFIIKNYSNQNTQKIMVYTFKKTSEFEEKLGIDLMDFNIGQLIDLLTFIKSPTVGALGKEFNVLKQYSKWAIENGYCENNSAFDQINRDALKEYVDLDINQKQYIKDRNELFNEFLPLIHNNIDKVIVVLLYEGLTAEEAINLDIDSIDIDKKEIRVLGKKLRMLIDVDKRSMEIIKGAIAQKTYENSNGKSSAKAPNRTLVTSKHIIRPISGSDGKMRLSGLRTRIFKIQEWTGKKYSDVTAIHYSGMFDKLRRIEVKEKRELNTSDYRRVLRDSGMNPNIYGQVKERYEHYIKRVHPK